MQEDEARRRFQLLKVHLVDHLTEDEFPIADSSPQEGHVIWLDHFFVPNGSAVLVYDEHLERFIVRVSVHRPLELDAWQDALKNLSPTDSWEDLFIGLFSRDSIDLQQLFILAQSSYDMYFRPEVIRFLDELLHSGSFELMSNVPFVLLGNSIYYPALISLFQNRISDLVHDPDKISYLEAGIDLMQNELNWAEENDAWIDYAGTRLERIFHF